jgi:hypothetical protein
LEPGEQKVTEALFDTSLSASWGINVSEVSPGEIPGQACFDKYAELYDCDILFYNGTLTLPYTAFSTILTRRAKCKNVLLILVTWGGSPHFAYRLARLLQEHYEKFSMLVSGICKSAGSLVAMGASEIIFSDYGELGPLDIQMAKSDEPFTYESGLVLLSVLKMLETQSADLYSRIGIKVLRNTEGVITTKTAAEIAAQFVTQLYAPLLARVDLIHLGETARALQIAKEYGSRLREDGDNLAQEALDHLISDYPSHAFAIDKQEARKLFKNIREPNPLELMIMHYLGSQAIVPADTTDLLNVAASRKFQFLNAEVEAFLPEEPIQSEESVQKNKKSQKKMEEAVSR